MIGFVVALLLYQLRQLFVWFPFHPIGYAMGPSWPMIQLWFSTMLGWVMKALLLHYGGLGAFRRWRPFSLSLLIGEYLTAGLWLVLDYAFKKKSRSPLLPVLILRTKKTEFCRSSMRNLGDEAKLFAAQKFAPMGSENGFP